MKVNKVQEVKEHLEIELENGCTITIDNLGSKDSIYITCNWHNGFEIEQNYANVRLTPKHY